MSRRIAPLAALLLILAILAVLPGAQAPPDSWTTRAPMPTARGALVVAEVGGLIYAIGGGDMASGLFPSSAVEVYDPGTDSWSTRTPLPVATAESTGAARGDTIYVFGGSNTSTVFDAVWAYNTTADSWTPKAPMSSVTHDACAVALGDRFHVLGGGSTWGGFGSTAHRVYNATTDSWSAAAPMQRSRVDPACAAVGNQVFVFGGWLNPPMYDEVEVYNTLTDRWSSRATSWPPYHRWTAVTFGPRVFLLGGNDYPSSMPNPTNVEYITTNDTWIFSRASMPTSREALGAAFISGKIYAIGGGDYGMGAFAVNEEYTIVPENTPPSVTILSPSDGATVTTSSALVEGNAGDDQGVALVEVRVNGGAWLSATGTTSWNFIATLVLGPNTIEARATDTSGNPSPVDAVFVTYAEPDTVPPVISISSPADNDSFTVSSIPAWGTAADPGAVSTGVDFVEVRVNGGAWALATGTDSWTAQVDLTLGGNLIEARAHDGWGNPSTVDRVTVAYVLSGNDPPTAAFAATPVAGTVATVFSFDASASSDPQDPVSVLETRWDFEDDGVFDTAWSTAKVATRQFTVPATTAVRLEVRDSGGLLGTTVRTVWVNDTPPTARFTAAPTEGDLSTLFTFDASASTDLEDGGAGLQVRWDFDGDGSWDTVLNTARQATHRFLAAGTYSVRLEVGDSGGLTAVAALAVVATAPAPGTPASRPTDVVATPVNHTAVVRWSPPTSQGSAPVTGYRIYRGGESGNLTLVAETFGSLTYTDGDVIPGDTYRYAIAAVNTAGEGLPSAPVEVVMPSCCEPPTDRSVPFDVLPWILALLLGIALVAVFLWRRRGTKREAS